MTHISLAVLLFSLEGSLYAQLFSQDAIPPGYRQPSCDYIKKTHEFNSFPTTFCQRASGWILDFSEEFNGDELDPDKWAIQNENCHAMSPSAYFSNSPENVRVEDGKLKLRVKESDAFDCTDPNTNPPVMKRYYYSGGWVVSQDNFHYGYFEMKCYIPGDIGLYPCFWMYGTIWPYMMTDYDEIDVFEKSLDDPSNTMLMQNYYHDTGLPGWQRLCQTLEFNQLYVGQENIFAVEWLPEEITFYINGNVTSTIRYATSSCYYSFPNPDTSPFTCTNFKYAIPQKFQISLSLSLFANPNPVLTSGFDIDYIRSFKLLEGEDEFWPFYFDLYNPDMFKVHKNIYLGGTNHSANIPSGINVTFWGRESITLQEGFILNPNTEFIARTIKTQPDLFQ